MVRTRRDSKAGFSFLELNDGSCFGNIQVIAEAGLANYESEIKAADRRIERHRRGRASRIARQGPGHRAGRHEGDRPRHGRPRDVRLAEETALVPSSCGPLPTCDRERTPFGAIARVRNCVCRSIHDFFQEEGFLYIHTPIITASDCEGAGEMFQVTTLKLDQLPKKGPAIDFEAGLLRPAGLFDRQWAARRRDLGLRPGQGLYVRPDVSRGELEHVAPSGRVLDGRTRNGVLSS